MLYIFLYVTIYSFIEVTLKIWLEPTNVCKEYWFMMNLE